MASEGIPDGSAAAVASPPAGDLVIDLTEARLQRTAQDPKGDARPTDDAALLQQVTMLLGSTPELDEVLDRLVRIALDAAWRRIRDAGVFVVEDARRATLFPAEWVERFDLHAVVVAPLLVDGETSGVMVVDYADGDVVGDAQVQLLETLTGCAALAVRNARLYAAASRRAAVQQLLARSAAALVDVDSPTAFAAALVDGYAELVGADPCAIGLFAADHTHVTTLALHGQGQTGLIPVAHVPPPIIEALTTAWTEDPTVTVSFEADAWLAELTGGGHAATYRVVPLAVGGIPRGCIVLGGDGRIRDAEARVAAEALRDLATAALERMQLLEQFQDEARRMEVLFDVSSAVVAGADGDIVRARLGQLLAGHVDAVGELVFADRALLDRFGTGPPTAEERAAWHAGEVVVELDDGNVSIGMRVDRRVVGGLRVRTADLHDTAGQSLVAIGLLARRSFDRLPADDATRVEIRRLVELADGGKWEIDQAVRALTHVPAGDRGLPAALAALADDFEHDSGIHVHLDITGDRLRLRARQHAVRRHHRAVGRPQRRRHRGAERRSVAVPPPALTLADHLMPTRTGATATAIALLLGAMPVAALAQEVGEDPCTYDPDAPECQEDAGSSGGSSGDEVDPGPSPPPKPSPSPSPSPSSAAGRRPSRAAAGSTAGAAPRGLGLVTGRRVLRDRLARGRRRCERLHGPDGRRRRDHQLDPGRASAVVRHARPPRAVRDRPSRRSRVPRCTRGAATRVHRARGAPRDAVDPADHPGRRPRGRRHPPHLRPPGALPRRRAGHLRRRLDRTGPRPAAGRGDRHHLARRHPGRRAGQCDGQRAPDRRPGRRERDRADHRLRFALRPRPAGERRRRPVGGGHRPRRGVVGTVGPSAVGSSPHLVFAIVADGRPESPIPHLDRWLAQAASRAHAMAPARTVDAATVGAAGTALLARSGTPAANGVPAGVRTEPDLPLPLWWPLPPLVAAWVLYRRRGHRRVIRLTEKLQAAM